MWTGPSKTYFALVRAEDAKHRARRRLKQSEQRAAAAAAEARSTAATTTRRAHPSKAFKDPSEGSVTVLNPIQALQLPTSAFKTIGEISFCGKQITDLHPCFQLFENLEVLVLQRNHISSLCHLMPPRNRSNSPDGSGGSITTSLCGPRGCVRLRQLYLSHNYIIDLEKTDIPRLLSLEHLYLAHNRLADLTKAVRLLVKLRSLSFLSLNGNPLAEEPAYRHTVIHHVPQVQVLDRQAITEEERRAAARFFAQKQANANACRPLTEVGTGAATNHNSSALVRVQSPPRPADGSTKGGAAAAAASPRRGSLFRKSVCVRMMESRRALYLTELEESRERLLREEEQRINTMEEKIIAFHGVWALSAAGMPLSEAKMKEWSVKPPTEPTAVQQPDEMVSPLLGGRQRRVGLNAKAGSGSIAGSISGVLLKSDSPAPVQLQVGQLLPLLPPRLCAPTAEEVDQQGAGVLALQKSIEQRQVHHPSYHHSVLYDALLGNKDALKAKMVPTSAKWSTESIPAPARLAVMDATLHASTALLLPIIESGETMRKGSVLNGSLTTAVPTAESMPMELDRELLREVHAGRPSMIPPPWEHVKQNTTIPFSDQQVQDYLVNMLRLFFLPQELASIESQFGAAEVLQILLANGANAAGAAVNSPSGNSGGGTPPTSSKGNRKPATRKTTRRTTSAGVNATANLLLQDQALLRLMQSALLILPPKTTTVTMLGGAPPTGSTGPATGNTGAQPSGSSNIATVPSNAAATVGKSAATLPPGVVGTYAHSSLDVILGLLKKESGAWVLPVKDLMEALIEAHCVDISTGGLQQTAEQAQMEEDEVRRREQELLQQQQALAAAAEEGKRRGGAARRRLATGQTNTKSSATRVDGRSGTSPGDRSKNGSASDANSTQASASGGDDLLNAAERRAKRAYLTVNNILAALVCFLPFVESRIEYFSNQSLKCSVGGERTSDAREWFTRMQESITHRNKLMSAAAQRFGADGARQARTAIIPAAALADRTVQSVGALFP